MILNEAQVQGLAIGPYQGAGERVCKSQSFAGCKNKNAHFFFFAK